MKEWKRRVDLRGYFEIELIGFVDLRCRVGVGGRNFFGFLRLYNCIYKNMRFLLKDIGKFCSVRSYLFKVNICSYRVGKIFD